MNLRLLIPVLVLKELCVVPSGSHSGTRGRRAGSRCAARCSRRPSRACASRGACARGHGAARLVLAYSGGLFCSFYFLFFFFLILSGRRCWAVRLKEAKLQQLFPLKWQRSVGRAVTSHRGVGGDRQDGGGCGRAAAGALLRETRGAEPAPGPPAPPSAPCPALGGRRCPSRRSQERGHRCLPAVWPRPSWFRRHYPLSRLFFVVPVERKRLWTGSVTPAGRGAESAPPEGFVRALLVGGAVAMALTGAEDSWLLGVTHRWDEWSNTAWHGGKPRDPLSEDDVDARLTVSSVCLVLRFRMNRKKGDKGFESPRPYKL